MLTDPLSVTFDGSTKSLPAASGPSWTGVARALGNRYYGTADGEFAVYTRQGSRKDGAQVSEVHLQHRISDSDVATVHQGYFYNSVGFYVVTNPYRVGSATEIPLIRSALDTLVTPTIMARIMNGEH